MKERKEKMANCFEYSRNYFIPGIIYVSSKLCTNKWKHFRLYATDISNVYKLNNIYIECWLKPTNCRCRRRRWYRRILSQNWLLLLCWLLFSPYAAFAPLAIRTSKIARPLLTYTPYHHHQPRLHCATLARRENVPIGFSAQSQRKQFVTFLMCKDWRALFL